MDIKSLVQKLNSNLYNAKRDDYEGKAKIDYTSSSSVSVVLPVYKRSVFSREPVRVKLKLCKYSCGLYKLYLSDDYRDFKDKFLSYLSIMFSSMLNRYSFVCLDIILNFGFTKYGSILLGYSIEGISCDGYKNSVSQLDYIKGLLYKKWVSSILAKDSDIKSITLVFEGSTHIDTCFYLWLETTLGTVYYIFNSDEKGKIYCEKVDDYGYKGNTLDINFGHYVSTLFSDTDKLLNISNVYLFNYDVMLKDFKELRYIDNRGNRKVI